MIKYLSCSTSKIALLTTAILSAPIGGMWAMPSDDDKEMQKLPIKHNQSTNNACSEDDKESDVNASSEQSGFEEINLSENSLDNEKAPAQSLQPLAIRNDNNEIEEVIDLSNKGLIGKEELMSVCLSERPVKALNLSGTFINKEGASIFSEARRFSTLRILNLSNSRVNEEVLRAISSSPYLTNLEELNLSSNKININSLKELTKGNLSKLEILDLSNNKIKLDKANIICNLLCEQTGNLFCERIAPSVLQTEITKCL